MATPASPKIVSKINRDFEERTTVENAGKWNLPYIDLEKRGLNNLDVLRTVSESEAKKAGLIPFAFHGHDLEVAVVDPTKAPTKALIAKLTKEKLSPKVFVCSQSGFNAVFANYQSELLHKKKIETRKEFTEERAETKEVQSQEFQNLEKKLPDLPVEKALNEIEILGMKSRASDIHFQPDEAGVTLRFRIDGVLHDVFKIDQEVAKQLVLRIKYEAGMQSNITDAPQDGRLSFHANDRQIDVRVSTLPTEYLESVTMRILDSRKGIKEFEDLGFSVFSREKIEWALKSTNGMILITGPTGSGKTTTLYSMLSKLNSAEKKLVTLEDPIEYHLEGVSQSPVNEKRDYNFENGLKALLRHDPDVILIGEIRELSTAKLASEGALTGHLVLSSLHTNSAVGAISRFRNLGMENFSIASSINAVFAQRLIRKACGCAQMKPVMDDPKLLESLARLKKIMPDLKIPEKILEKVGCEKCYHTGYAGRMVICESYIMTEALKKLILANTSDIDIKKHLESQSDYMSLFEDGVLKVIAGETTLEEIYRVAG